MAGKTCIVVILCLDIVLILITCGCSFGSAWYMGVGSCLVGLAGLVAVGVAFFGLSDQKPDYFVPVMIMQIVMLVWEIITGLIMIVMIILVATSPISDTTIVYIIPGIILGVSLIFAVYNIIAFCCIRGFVKELRDTKVAPDGFPGAPPAYA